MTERRFEVVEDAMAEILRRKTGLERLEIAGRLCRGARRLVRVNVSIRKPNWSEAKIDREASRRVAGGSA